jgi:predicted  nucleic acid-binding Zn-ribbon protein
MSNETKDLLDELLTEDLTPEEGTDGTATDSTSKDVSTLNEKIEALEKERHGLLQDVKSERRKRQNMSGQLDQLTNTVNGILSTRQQLAADPNIQTVDDSGIPVDFDEDGDGTVRKDAIKDLLTPYEQEIKQLKEQLEHTNSMNAAQREAENVKRSIIGEDERFEIASRKYDSARRWVTDQVTDFARQNNIGRALTSGEALDYVFDADSESAFKEKFPGLRIEDIVTAEDSQRHYRNTLSHIADVLNPESPDEKLDGRFQKVLRKPSGLGNQQNAKGGELTVAEKVGSLETQDIMDLSDAQIAALERALLSEEKSDGVRF